MRFVECPATHIKTNWVTDTSASIDEQKSYAAARVRDILFEAIAEAMERGNVKRADLAKRLGTTRSAITRLLDSENPTIKTIGEALWACDAELSDVELKTFGETFCRNEDIRTTFVVSTSASAQILIPELEQDPEFDLDAYAVVTAGATAA